MDAFVIHPPDSKALKVATDTSARLNEKVNPNLKYVRDFVRTLPKVDEKGMVYKLKPSAVGKVGKAKDSDKDYLVTGAQLRGALPYNPHYVTRPDDRVRSLRPDSGHWTDAAMKVAREQFYIPAGVKLIFVFPELFERDLLRHSEPMQVGSWFI